MGECPFCFRNLWEVCQSLYFLEVLLNQTAHSVRALEVLLCTCQVLKSHTVGRVDRLCSESMPESGREAAAWLEQRKARRMRDDSQEDTE